MIKLSMKASPWPRKSVLLAALFAIACSESVNRECTPIAASEFAVPQLLSETGLYANTAEQQFAADVSEFTPQFPLWTDGAKKRRWIALPEGQKIDTRNPDFWSFPTGTKLWKEFVVQGVLVETRYMYKYGPNDSDWDFSAYIWDADSTDAQASLEGQIDAMGSEHDVPQAADCVACHRPETGSVLGFSAVQLAYNAPTSKITLEYLSEAELTSHAIAQTTEVPGTEVDQFALGYLHANCAHCHSGRQANVSTDACFDPDSPINFRLELGSLANLESTNAYLSIQEHILQDNNTNRNELLNRISSRGDDFAMPPLGTEVVDSAASDRLEAWFETFP